MFDFLAKRSIKNFHNLRKYLNMELVQIIQDTNHGFQTNVQFLQWNYKY